MRSQSVCVTDLSSQIAFSDCRGCNYSDCGSKLASRLADQFPIFRETKDNLHTVPVLICTVKVTFMTCIL